MIQQQPFKRNQRSNCQHPLDYKKAREFQKNVYFCFSDYAKAFDCGSQQWKILKVMGIPDHLTCLLQNLYAGQEATVRTRHGAMDWFQTGKEYVRLYIVTLLEFSSIQSLSYVQLFATPWTAAH